MIMLGMGAGPHADAQYLFSEDVFGHTAGHSRAMPRPTATSSLNMSGCCASASPPIASSCRTRRQAPIPRRSTWSPSPSRACADRAPPRPCANARTTAPMPVLLREIPGHMITKR
ncbi:hypothetical protein [Mesorhizobium qingshengii]|uniref:hypothetical protein n=1 Tax=Mesorhizobium qingshengii TaxID=1165689 RepID=UPI003CC7AA6D